MNNSCGKVVFCLSVNLSGCLSEIIMMFIAEIIEVKVQ